MKPIPGWPGAKAQYLGRYNLIKSSDPTLATSGELVIFTRIVPPVRILALSGILTLVTKGDTNVVYLTHFVHAGAKLWTQVNLGIYTGPVLGRFTVTAIKGNDLSGTLTPAGQAPVKLSFVRFTKSPHP